MKRIRIVLVALAVSLSAPFAGSATAQAHSGYQHPRAVISYVALGDSYSAGVGNGEYGTSGECMRSAKAYPELLDDRYDRLELVEAGFRACSGATTDSLVDDQLPAAPNGDVEKVTVTIGGNDIGTFTLLPDCLGLDGVPGCSEIGKGNLAHAIKHVLPGKMANALNRIHAAYPNGTVYVGGYMQLFGDRKEDCTVGQLNSQSFSVNYADKVWLNKMARKLNATIKAAVRDARSTMPAKYVDVSHVFDGHGLCDSRRPWFFTLDATNLQGLLHPTLPGQRAYARAFHAAGVTR